MNTKHVVFTAQEMKAKENSGEFVDHLQDWTRDHVYGPISAVQCVAGAVRQG